MSDQSRMPPERRKQVIGILGQVGILISEIREVELLEIKNDVEVDSTVGPMLAPTEWQDGQRFEVNRKVSEMVGLLLHLRLLYSRRPLLKIPEVAR